PVLRRERRELDLGRIIQHRGRERAAEIDVEAGPVALVIRTGKSRKPLADAADERASILHPLERLGGGRRHRKAEREGRTKEKDCACHGTAFHEDGHFQVWTATCVIWKVFFNATILVRAGVPGRRRVPNATACAGRAVVWPLSQNDRARRSRG